MHINMLVSYSSTSVSVHREEDDSKSRLPLPGSLLDMFTEEDDDPQTRGNWATYVYLPYIPEEGFLELLDKMTKVAGSHDISLTHTDEHHWIQPSIQSLRTGLAHGRRSPVPSMPPFTSTRL
uniref:Uncharacterized protein n=1 Tax=Salmo trutta TaxID=8032 RepID=A0A673WV01_SALTR